MADMKPILCGKNEIYIPQTECEDCLKQRDVVAGSNVSITYNGDGTVTINSEPGDLSNYYTKDETYTKQEIDELVEAIESFDMEIVSELPATGEERTIYLVPKSGGTGKDEYLWVNNAWEKIGDTDVDLSDYYNKTETDNLLANKVDKVTGKGLSTNDFTDALKTKLEGIDPSSIQSKLTPGQYIAISNNTISVNLTKADILDILGYKETTMVLTGTKSGETITKKVLVEE